MSLSKLRQIHVIIIGAFLCVAAAAALYFLMVKPKNDELAAAQARYDSAYMDPSAEKTAQEKLLKAQQTVTLEQAQFQNIMNKRMPKLNFADRAQGMTQLWTEFGSKLNSIVSGYAHSDKKNMVFTVLQPLTPPVNPNDPIFDQDIIELKLGGIVAQGKSFSNLMDNVRRWNNCGRLIMVGPPQIAGSSPKLLVGYSLTCYIFPTSKGGAKVDLAGAPGAAGAAGAPAGGPPAGGGYGGAAGGMPPR